MLALDHAPISSDDYRVLLKRKQWTHAIAARQFGIAAWTSKSWAKTGVPSGPAATVVRLALGEDPDQDPGAVFPETTHEKERTSAPVEYGDKAANALGETAPVERETEDKPDSPRLNQTPDRIAMAAALKRIERIENKVDRLETRLAAPGTEALSRQPLFPIYAEFYAQYTDEILEALICGIERILEERKAAGPEKPLKEINDPRELFEPDFGGVDTPPKYPGPDYPSDEEPTK